VGLFILQMCITVVLFCRRYRNLPEVMKMVEQRQKTERSNANRQRVQMFKQVDELLLCDGAKQCSSVLMSVIFSLQCILNRFRTIQSFMIGPFLNVDTGGEGMFTTQATL